TTPPSPPLSFTDPPTTAIYTLSLHDALPICQREAQRHSPGGGGGHRLPRAGRRRPGGDPGLGDARGGRRPRARRVRARAEGAERSEEHTSELQSRSDLVCRLLLEKKKKIVIK